MTQPPRHHCADPALDGAGLTIVPDDLYASPPPWDINRPQLAFLALTAAGDIRGRVLDVGCGTGEHALMASGLGPHATGIDTSLTLAGRTHSQYSEWLRMPINGGV